MKVLFMALCVSFCLISTSFTFSDKCIEYADDVVECANDYREGMGDEEMDVIVESSMWIEAHQNCTLMESKGSI